MGYIGSGPTRFNTADELTVTGDAEITGAITTDGMTTTGDVSFGDNDKAIFGAGSDLQIYHDGSNSIINDAGTGSLKFQYGGTDGVVFDSSGNVKIGTATDSWSGSNTLVIKEDSGDGGITLVSSSTSNNMNIGFADTQTSSFADMRGMISYLHANDAMRFITANTEAMRIDSSGNVIIGSGGLDVSGIGGTYTALNMRAGAGYPVIYGQTTATVTNSPAMQIVGATSGASAGGAAEFLGIIQIAAESDSSTHGAGYINFYTGSGGGGASERMRITSSGNVGIGGAPSELLHIKNASGDAAVRIDGNTRTFNIQQNNYGLRFVDVDAGSAERLRIDAAGRVTMPYQPSFAAVLTTSPTATSGAVIPVNSAPVNIGNHFNTSTYTFTAPVSGRYFLSYFVRWNGYQASIYLHPRFYKNGGSFDYTHQIASIGTSTGAAYTSLTWSGVVQLAANDAITLHDASQGGVTLGTYQGNQTGFTGHLIG